MKTIPTKIPGVILLSPPQFPDERGIFRPIFAQRLHADTGYDHPWAEMNLSHTEAGCIRGLHFQDPQAQAKLITVVSGTIYDVVIDLRKDSPTFCQWDAFRLSSDSSEAPSQIYIPEGFAHGLATPNGPATIAYMVSKPWNSKTEQVIKWDDPDLNIPWPLENPKLSERDQCGISLENIRNL